MEKTNYEECEIEVITFEGKDVICDSSLTVNGLIPEFFFAKAVYTKRL